MPAGEVEADLEAVSRQYGLARYLDVDGSGKAVKVAESTGSRFHRLLPETPGYGLAEILAPCGDGYLYCLRGEGG